PRWTVTRRAWAEVIAGWIAVAGQTLFRTDLLRDSGGWQVGMSVAEDQDLWLRLGYDRPAVLVPAPSMGNGRHGRRRRPLTGGPGPRGHRPRRTGGAAVGTQAPIRGLGGPRVLGPPVRAARGIPRPRPKGADPGASENEDAVAQRRPGENVDLVHVPGEDDRD